MNVQNKHQHKNFNSNKIKKGFPIKVCFKKGLRRTDMQSDRSFQSLWALTVNDLSLLVFSLDLVADKRCLPKGLKVLYVPHR